MKKVYFDCSCHGFHCVVRFAYFPEDKDYLYVETFLSEVGFFRRLWRSIKYTFGFYTPYTDSVLDPDTAVKVRNCLDDFLDYNLIPGESRSLFDWMVKYDPSLAGKPREIIATLIKKGADQLYKEGLENADPLPDEVAKALAESQAAALAEALKSGSNDYYDEQLLDELVNKRESLRTQLKQIEEQVSAVAALRQAGE